MKSSTKRFLSFAFLVLTFTIVLWIGFKGNDPYKIWQEIKSISPYWLLVFIFCWIMFIFMEAVSLYFFLRSQNFKVSIFSLFRIAIIGNYYSNITPASTGGQPMQIYYLKKLGVPVGIGTSTLTIKFFIFQLSLLTVGGLLWILNAEFIYNQLGNKIWLVLTGFFFNSISVLGVLLLAINKRLINWLMRNIISLLEKLRLIKNKEKITFKVEKTLETFNDSVDMIRKDSLQLLFQYILTSIQILFFYLITVAIYHAFALKGVSNMELICLSALLFISASFTPLPGASGAQEGGFAIFFNGIFPGSSLFSALLLWRFFSYYTTLIVGIIMSIRSMFVGKQSE